MIDKKTINFPGITSLDSNPDNVLKEAIGTMKEIIIIGYDKEGEFYFATSQADGGDVVWLLELAKKKLFEVAEELEED